MDRVQLIHWNSSEAKLRAEILKDAGYEVAWDAPKGPEFLRELRRDLPIAVVIDLARLPSHGRDMALAIRKQKAMRYVPLVLVDGDSKKVAAIQAILPDAVYTSWNRMRDSLKRAIAHPPTVPVTPKSLFEGYSGKPLITKLGIKAHSIVALIGAPEEFTETLGKLPVGVVLSEQARDQCDLIIWFTRSRKDLQRSIKRMTALTGPGSLWIVWPKKTSALASDLSQKCVREIGLGAGLVDFKICAINETWSGLLFTRRRTKQLLLSPGQS